jgi:hypothetical protein
LTVAGQCIDALAARVGRGPRARQA